MTRVLVAGGTGFLGSAIVERLLSEGARPTVLSRHPSGVAARFTAGAVEGRAGDVTRPETLPPALADVDTVVQCVQFSGYPVEAPARGRTFMEVDARGTQAVVDAALEAGVRKIVYLSGVGADPDSPRSWYRAKGRAEASVRASGLAWSIVRPSWVYGPRDESLNRFVTVIRAVPFVFPQLGPGTQRIDPLYIDDLAALVVAATLGTSADGEILEAGGPETLTLDDVVRTAMRVLGRRKPIVHVPLALVKLAARFLELVPGQVLSRDAVDFITQDGVADPTVLSRCFPSFSPRDLESALSGYLA